MKYKLEIKSEQYYNNGNLMLRFWKMENRKLWKKKYANGCGTTAN